MQFLLYKFQWTEWDRISITDQGTGFYFAKHPCDISEIEQMVTHLINKPATADITLDEIEVITSTEYERTTGEPFHL
ncbi:MAG: hypothetical protein JWR61_4600 [Ferruginibacter sp.]|uniref:hypothetical protein n=1 Tax=Ferruginibacter sp. TaxID=1940288 RepID=UPI00265ACE41|nr:hypothetical protein [Ferruginibacter sp.]MDB5279645.1 hypothetical protein [Ferruginibacter sp.]